MSFTATFNTIANITSFDCRNSDSNYTTARNAASADSLGGNTVGVDHTSAPKFFIHRFFMPFDTSSLRDDVILRSAILKIYPTTKSDSDNNGRDYVVVVLSSASNPSLPTTNDYSAFTLNSPIEGSDRIDITSITLNAYNTWTLNSSGLGWISRTGISQLALRTGDDTEGIAPSLSGNSGNSIGMDLTTNVPQLVITYDLPAPGLIFLL